MAACTNVDRPALFFWPISCNVIVDAWTLGIFDMNTKMG
jgi:hypothetical protein